MGVCPIIYDASAWWMCDSATSLQLPRGTGEGGGPKGTREGLRTHPLLSPNCKFWGSKFAWPNYWKFVGKSGKNIDFGVNLICIWMEAQSSFPRVICISISPSIPWGKRPRASEVQIPLGQNSCPAQKETGHIPNSCFSTVITWTWSSQPWL